MEKLERVQATSYRRMEQLDAELERLEERPEPDLRRRYGLLRRRFEQVEKVHYRVRCLQAPNPLLLIPQILSAPGPSFRPANVSVPAPSTRNGNRHPRQGYRGFLY